MKVIAPLFSEEASGSIAEITFSKRKEGQLARFQRKQKDVLTSKREAQRNKFFLASLACTNMEFGNAIFGVSLYGNEKEFYIKEAKNKNLTWYNVCISEYIACQK